MSARNVHATNAASSVRTNQERRSENMRQQQIARDQRQRASQGVVTSAGRSGSHSSQPSKSGHDSQSSSSSSHKHRHKHRPQLSLAASGAGIVQAFTLMSAFGVLIVAFVVVIDAMDPLDVCDDGSSNQNNNQNNNENNGIECYMSSLLFWSAPGVDETDNNLNSHWRTVFGLNPIYFFDVWTPMLFAIISILQVIHGTEWNMITGHWVKCMLWHIIMALFGCFGFAGQVGLIIGTLVCVTAMLCLLAALMRWKGRPYVTLSCR